MQDGTVSFGKQETRVAKMQRCFLNQSNSTLHQPQPIKIILTWRMGLYPLGSKKHKSPKC
jgi:hypothetical protein